MTHGRSIWGLSGVPAYTPVFTGTQRNYVQRNSTLTQLGWLVTYRDCLPIPTMPELAVSSLAVT